MAWTHEQRMERAIARLIDEDILSLGSSEYLNRPRFFNKYAFCVGMSPTLTSWHKFAELREFLHQNLDQLGTHIVSVKHTYDFYIYGNDPAILRWIQMNHENFFVNFIRQTNPMAWDKPLPKSKPHTRKFYGQYSYRMIMKDRHWGVDTDNLQQLVELQLAHKLVLRKFSHSVTEQKPQGLIRDTMIYVDKLAEVLVLKLIFADQVKEVEERS
jgi:hypothetical protein